MGDEGLDAEAWRVRRPEGRGEGGGDRDRDGARDENLYSPCVRDRRGVGAGAPDRVSLGSLRSFLMTETFQEKETTRSHVIPLRLLQPSLCQESSFPLVACESVS